MFSGFDQKIKPDKRLRNGLNSDQINCKVELKNAMRRDNCLSNKDRIYFLHVK